MQAKPVFNPEDVEDVRIIVKAKGLHYTVLAAKGKEQEATFDRIVAFHLTINQGNNVICAMSLEEYKTIKTTQQ